VGGTEVPIGISFRNSFSITVINNCIPRRAHGPVLLPDFLPEFPEASGEPAAPVACLGESFDPEAFLRQRLGPDAGDLYAEIHWELDRLLLPSVLA
jgi:hypothetical protein